VKPSLGPKHFPVTLTIKDNHGCESKDIYSVNVQNRIPKAHIGSTNTNATCPPLDGTFYDPTAAGNFPIVKRYWTFGDGTYSNKTNPSKLYIYSGKYAVSLTVTNALGFTDSAKIADLVVVKGPRGGYTFDKKYGCTPLNVNLNTKTIGAIKKFEFDMGYGTVLDTSGKLHIYKLPGEYIPRLILTDTTGCRFSPPPSDTIHVYPTPKAYFKNKIVCDNVLTTIRDSSEMAVDILKNIKWRMAGKILSYSDSLNIVFGKPGKQFIELWVQTQHACADSIKKPFLSYGITPTISKTTDEYCLGNKISLNEISTSDTFITKRELWIDNDPVLIQNPIVFYANRKGLVPMKLIINDALGCSDTLIDASFLKVGDTLPPPSLNMLRSTVVDDFTTETRFSQTLENDFKEYQLYCWNNGWNLGKTSSNITDTNLQINGLNTLQNSYCHKIVQSNFCNKTNDLISVIPHCTIETKAVGDTNKAYVKWSAYGG